MLLTPEPSLQPPKVWELEFLVLLSLFQEQELQALAPIEPGAPAEFRLYHLLFSQEVMMMAMERRDCAVHGGSS